jgi:hypothetical protein
MTAAVPAPAVQVAPAWTTPQILKTAVVAICAASLLMMLVAIAGARSHRHAVQAIGKDSAPSIIAAQHIRAALADMDADAANELLLGDHGAPRRAFEQRRDEAIAGLVSAAENITYGERERKPIHNLALGMGTYTGLVTEARVKQAAGDKSFLSIWRSAADYMDSTLLPEAQKLDDANRSELDKAYEGQRTASVQAAVLLILSGALLGCVLIALQIFLAGRMKRVLNPMLFLATLGTLIFVIYAGQRFNANDRNLKTAKVDAFDAIHALWKARALAYSANSDESRYLLDPSQAAKYEAEFQAKAGQIADEFLAGEMNAFEGERESAQETLKEFARYREIDRRIRALEKGGQHAAAIALCTGEGNDQSNGVFARFDGELGKTLEINQHAFDASVGRGFADVAGFEWIAPVAAFLISVFAWLGLRPRIREYSV